MSFFNSLIKCLESIRVHAQPIYTQHSVILNAMLSNCKSPKLILKTKFAQTSMQLFSTCSLIQIISTKTQPEIQWLIVQP